MANFLIACTVKLLKGHSVPLAIRRSRVRVTDQPHNALCGKTPHKPKGLLTARDGLVLDIQRTLKKMDRKTGHPYITEVKTSFY